MMEKIEIHEALSIGDTCMASHLLKKNNLKRKSYPFDWIFSNLDMVEDCIQDGFVKFLDKNAMRRLPDPEKTNQCGHLHYGNPPDYVIFNHHNPLDNEEEYQYFKRCIKRFYETMALPQTTLLFLVYRYIPFSEIENSKNRVLDFNQKLKSILVKRGILHPNYRIFCLFIRDDQCSLSHPESYHFTVKNCDFSILHLTSEIDKIWGLAYMNPLDNAFVDKNLLEMYNFVFSPEQKNEEK